MEYVYVYQEKQENNNTGTCRAANNFLFDTNFLIKICICKACSKKLVSNGGSPVPILGKCNPKMKQGPKRCKANYFVVDLKSKPLLGLKTSLELVLLLN